MLTTERENVKTMEELDASLNHIARMVWGKIGDGLIRLEIVRAFPDFVKAYFAAQKELAQLKTSREYLLRSFDRFADHCPECRSRRGDRCDCGLAVVRETIGVMREVA